MAHPIPNVVSYAPMVTPDDYFDVFRRIISSVNGKITLNPNPMSNMAPANSKIEFEKNDTMSPANMVPTDATRVAPVRRASLAVIARVMTRDAPNTK